MNESTFISVSDRRGSGKPRPKSEGFELYNNSAQNGSPESPQLPWTEYSEPKKLPGDDRLMKNRADHRSSPNVASKKNHSLRVFGHCQSEWAHCSLPVIICIVVYPEWSFPRGIIFFEGNKISILLVKPLTQ